ncbi:integral membrane protein [Annulohypoxylon bovei var. microspora]|nr:integral membrane protein [Annulohypoxylon bovei var. microspora]
MASKALIPLLVGMMLLTGVCNTLFTKYQDNQCVRNCDDPDPKNRKTFEQPVLQTAQMFVGEVGCWLVVGVMAGYQKYKSRKSPKADGYQAVDTADADIDNDNDAASITSEHPLVQPAKAKRAGSPDGLLRGYGILLLALPAICDILGTTLVNAGLFMVAASIYQMTRGALVLFVGLFSVVFLQRKLHLFQWVSLIGVVTGVALVGLAGFIWPDTQNALKQAADDATSVDALRAALGVVLIAGAQIFTATQFVLEEFLLERSSIEAIEVVGWEGLFGLAVTLICMLVLHLVVGRTEAGRYGMFDMVEGFRQMVEYKAVWVSSLLTMVSIGGFNFFGLSVTRSVSATARSTIDSCRTLFIWIVSLGLGWESFKGLQVAGFALLVYFTFLFNGVVQPPFKFLQPTEEVEELLPEEPIEHN